MRLSASIGVALALHGSIAVAKLHTHDKLVAVERRHHNHQHVHRDAQPSPAEIGGNEEEKRGLTCAWPSNMGLVHVPGAMNQGWAMSPDQPCTAGNWCQYACPSGALMTSWNPAFISYPSKVSTTYTDSKHVLMVVLQDGGIFCGLDGNLVLPNAPLCKQGATNIKAVDATGKGVSFCQTVAPGNEAQLIPTWIPPNGDAVLAIPQPDYFGKIPAHYYINEPGSGISDSCIWGDQSNSVGNWATFVGGGLQTADGKTWIDLGLNPKYKDNFSGKPINFKVEIVCDGECNNPCSYDPSKHGLLEMVGTLGNHWNVGVDGVPYCTTCITSGNAYYKVSMLDGSNTPSGPGQPSSVAAASSTSAPSSPVKSSSLASSPSSISPSAISGKDNSTSTERSSSSSTKSASATAWSPHAFLQQNSTATVGETTSTDSATMDSATMVVASITDAIMATVAPAPTSSGAASHFAAPATGLALTGLAAFFFL